MSIVAVADHNRARNVRCDVVVYSCMLNNVSAVVCDMGPNYILSHEGSCAPLCEMPVLYVMCGCWWG